MILEDGLGGLDTRETVAGPGPYCDGMAIILDRIYMGGDFGDDTETDVGGGGLVRYGRRILQWDSVGFIGSHRFATVTEAEAVMEHAHAAYDEEDDYAVE